MKKINEIKLKFENLKKEIMEGELTDEAKICDRLTALSEYFEKIISSSRKKTQKPNERIQKSLSRVLEYTLKIKDQIPYKIYHTQVMLLSKTLKLLKGDE